MSTAPRLPRLFWATAVAALAALALAGCAPEPDSAAPPASTVTPAPSAVPTPAPKPTAPPAPIVREDLRGLAQAELDSRLIAAAWANDVPEAEALIVAGADVNAKDETVQSAYLVATSEGYAELLALTLAHGADLASLDSYNGTGLIRAAERGHTAVVGTLITSGISLDHVNFPGYVALHEALIYAKPEQVQEYQDTARVLIAAGVDLSIPTVNTGETPEMLAVRYGLGRQAELIRLALQAPIPAADAQAALYAAAAAGDPDRTALALRAGAEISAVNAEGETALGLATAGDHPVTVTLLTSLGGS